MNNSVNEAANINNSSDSATASMNFYSEAWKITLFFIIVLTIVFYPAVFQNKLIYSGDLTGSDLLELNIPRRALLAAAVRDGEIPLWEPKLGNGICLLAEGQAAPFYPTTLPLYLTLSLTQATNISILSTLLIAMLGSYALSRSYKLNPLAACFGGLAFGLGGAFIFRLKHLNMIQVIAWLPWSLFALRSYWMTRRRIFIFILFSAWTLQVFAGHPHVCYICWLTAYIYGLALVWECKNQPQSRQKWYHLLGIMLITTSLVLLICSVQLLPTWELSKTSSRATPEPWQNLKYYPFKWKHTLRLIYPFLFDNAAKQTTLDPANNGLFWEASPYIGIVPLLLAIISISCTKYHTKAIYSIIILVLLFYLSALGPKCGVYWLFWKFSPGFNLFRFPARMLIPCLCFLSILSSWGGQCVYNLLQKKHHNAIKITFIGLLCLTILDLYHINNNYQEYLPNSWENKPTSLSIITNPQRLYSPMYIFSWEKILNNRSWYNNIDRTIYALNTLPPDIAAIWQVNCPSDRIVFDGGIELMLYFEIQAWQFSNFITTLNEEQSSFEISPYVTNWLRSQSISHVLSFIPLGQVGTNPFIKNVTVLQQPEETNPLYIYALRDPLPKTRLIDPNLTLELPEFAQFIRDNYPTYQAGSLYEPNIGSNPSIGTADILHEGHNYLTISTECSRDSFLIVSNTYHPNWRISIDDSPPVPVTRVNYAFQGAPIPAGRHRVTLRFASPAFDLGWKISAATLLALLALWGWSSFRNRPHFG